MLSKKQKEIVESGFRNIIVMSSAASGKTRVLTERIKYLLDNGADPQKMVVLTFTNAAAEEMKKRIGKKSKDIFIGTVHSYANYLLLSSGHATSKFIEEENFDMFFNELEKYPECIKKVDYLLLDEAQDSNESQFKFILDIIKPKSFFIVGDNRQAIYEWRGGRPDMFYDLTFRGDVKTYHLNENYRNGANILSFAKSFILPLGVQYQDNSIPKSSYNGKLIKAKYDLNKIVSTIKEDGQYGDWFILTRSNSDLDEIYDSLIENNIPCDTFKRSELSNDDLNKKMLDNTVKVLTIHASKGLESKKVIVVQNNPAYDSEEKRVYYVAATRAKELLIWMNKTKKKIQTTNWE